ncbi:RNA polymerase subunit sigma-70 [Mucilaginibacter sp. PPCGB 2223]|uniref:RNA polymerase sigma factor n=1 Tax=Mucilaginibacter sp. PPCGB 2223 TaxID=1886027 RepID=UPI0008244D8D|nr:RNA polymerase sigma factor [Mucilaginibacter sp. PPCGB 2223]OCX53464.1 RNA polymerase subunit sigma-70 [Mucilaginibacter sp. PPCGB 2223]
MVEELLIEQLKNKQQSAFRQVVELYQNMVFNTALSMLQNREEAEDIAQEVFIQVYESVQKFKGESKLSTWVYRITITKVLDWQRHKQRKKRFALISSLFGTDNEVERDVPDFVHPGVLMENKERSVILFKALDKLPENQKVAFVLNKIEGQNYQEVADIMGVTVGAVESYMHRAKQNLRKLLETYYHTDK